MKLDEKIFHLAESVDSEVQRMLERLRGRIAPYDDVAHDDRNARLTYRKGEEILFNALTEEVATLGADGSFSWGWAQRPGYMKRTRKVEVAKSLFDELGLKQLLENEITLEDRGHAERLVRIVLNASRADGVFRIERGTRTIYYALFESAGTTAPPNRVPSGKLVRRMTPSGGSMRVTTSPSFRPSNPAMPAMRPLPREEGSAPRIESVGALRTSSGTMAAVAPAPVSSRPNQMQGETPAPQSQRVTRAEPASPLSSRPSQISPRSHPPIEMRESRPEIEVPPPPPSRPSASVPPPREPSRPHFMPVAQAVFADIAAVLPGRITQAVLIVNVRRAETKTYSLEVVAMDAEGAFRAVEASRDLRRIVSEMIAVDESSGNGTWRRLVAYITMKDGAKLTFEVK